MRDGEKGGLVAWLLPVWHDADNRIYLLASS